MKIERYHLSMKNIVTLEEYYPPKALRSEIAAFDDIQSCSEGSTTRVSARIVHAALFIATLYPVRGRSEQTA